MRGRGRGSGAREGGVERGRGEWGEGGGGVGQGRGEWGEGGVELTQSCFYVSDFFLQVLTISVSSRQVTNLPLRALFTPGTCTRFVIVGLNYCGHSNISSLKREVIENRAF